MNSQLLNPWIMRINYTYEEISHDFLIVIMDEWRQCCISLFLWNHSSECGFPCNLSQYYNYSPQHIWNDFLHSGYKGQRCIVSESAYSNSDDEQWDVLQSPRPPSSLLVSLLPCSLPIEATMFMVIISPSERSQRAPWCSWCLTVRGQKVFRHHEDSIPTEMEHLLSTAWAFCTFAFVFILSFLPIVRAFF